MTYAEKVYAMTGAQLVAEAEKVGAKVNRKGNTLKEAKATAADKIIAAYEAQHAETEEPAEVVETVEAVETETAPAEEPKKEKKARKPREQKEEVTQILNYIITEWEKHYGTIKMHGDETKGKFCALCTDTGRQVIKLVWTNKSVRLCTRLEDIKNIFTDVKTVKYNMPYQTLVKEYNADIEKNLDALFELTITDVRKKKEKKAE